MSPSDECPRPTLIRGARALASALGVTHTAVNGWLKDERWPFGDGPWPAKLVLAIRSWRARTLAPDPNSYQSAPDAAVRGDDLSQLSLERRVAILLKREKIETERLNRQIKSEKLHSVEDCQRRRLRQIHALKSELLAFADTLPASVDPTTRNLVHEHILALLRRLAAMTSG